MIPTPRSLPTRTIRHGRQKVLALGVLVALGAGPPRVERLQVPAGQVGSVFPAGTEVVSLPTPELNRLLRAGERADSRPAKPGKPRLLRAEHQARWDGQTLIGQSLLIVRGEPTTVSRLDLAPWTAAVVGADNGQVVADDQGHPWLRIEPGFHREVTVQWRIAGQAETDGCRLSLGLGRADVASWTFDLPDGTRPRFDRGLPRLSEASASPGRQLWRLEGLPGDEPLALRLLAAGAHPEDVPSFWIQGATEVELNDADAAWHARWVLDRSRFAPRELTIEPDEGLELLDVEGDSVAGFRSVEGGPGVVIRFRDAASGPTVVTLRGLARLPNEGAWPIPAVHPRDGVWMGGRTQVRLRGKARRLLAVRERGGYEVRARDTEATNPAEEVAETLVFETGNAASPAELVFAPAAPRAVAAVRGRMKLDGERVTFEAEMSWSFEGGRPALIEADVTPGWIVEDVRHAGSDEPATWHLGEDEGGGSHLWVSVPPATESGRPAGFRVAGGRAEPEASQRLELVRIRPRMARIREERWVAWPAAGMTATAGEAEGLVWFDPPLEAPAPPGQEGSGLAWRWIAADARGSLTIVPVSSGAADRVIERLLVRADRPEIEVRLLIASGTDPIRFGFSGPVETIEPWQSIAGPPVPIDALEGDESPFAGPGWAATRNGGVGVELRGRFRVAREGADWLPLLSVESSRSANGTILVFTPATLRMRSEAEGVFPIPESVARLLAPPTEPSGLALGPGWRYDPRDRTARLREIGEPLVASGPESVISMARLTSAEGPGGSWRRRLTLSVSSASADTLRVTLPAGGEPLGAAVAGRAAALEAREGALLITLPWPTPAEGAIAIQLDYRDPSGGPDGAWPGLSLPCLTRTRYRVRAPADLGPLLPGLGVVGEESPEVRREAMGGWLDRLPRTAADDLTLGEVLRRLDTGAWPVLVDQVGLSEASLSPATRLTSHERDTADLDSWLTFLTRQRLGVRAIAGVVLLHASPDPPDIAPDVIREALVRGADPSQRFATARQWTRTTAMTATSRGGEPGLDAPPELREGALVMGNDTPPPSGRAAFGSPALAWAITLAAMSLALALRDHRGGRALLLLLLLLSGLSARAGEKPLVARGCAAAAMVVCAAWGGRLLRGPRGGPGAGESDLVAGRMATAALLLGGILLALGPGVRPLAAWEDTEPPPALVRVVTVEGRPEQSFLTRADFDRLQEAIRSRPTENAASGPLALAVAHEVRFETPARAVVTTDWRLVLEQAGPQAWTFPIAGEREITATIDGAAASVEILPAGQTARIWVEGAGPHRLIVRRVPELQARGSSVALRLSVGAAATATLSVQEPPGATVALRLATSPDWVPPRDDEGRARIGPVDRMLLSWDAPGDPAPPAALPLVESLMLWDALPTGDRVVARWIARGATPLDTLRIVHDGDLLLRGVRAGGEPEPRTTSEESGTVTIVRTSRPLPAGGVMEVEFWRKSRDGREARDRAWPRVAATGVQPGPTTLGFRRPGGWTGRLAEGPGAEVVPDETFVRTWGDLPLPAATLAGVVRFNTPPRRSLAVGPPTPRTEVRSKLRADVEPGRLNLTVEAELLALEGRQDEFVVRPPSGWRVLSVSGPGVRDWSQAEDGRIRIRLPGERLARPLLTLEGWMALPPPPASGAQRIALPAFEWPALESGGTEVTLSAPSGSALSWEPAEAGSLPSAALPLAGAPVVLGPLKVNGSTPSPGTLVVARARVSSRTSLRCSLTVWPDSAELDSTLRYRPAGIAGESFVFSLPTVWSQGAEVRSGGPPLEIARAERGDETLWTIRPQERVFGTLDVHVRARRSYDPEQPLAYPTLVPRGAGELVGRELTLRDATGRFLHVEGTGVEEVTSAPLGRESPPASFEPPARSFRVSATNWQLMLRPPEGPAIAAGALADLHVALSGDGSVVGWGHYTLGGTVPPFLSFRAGAGSEVLAAALDGRPLRLLRSADGGYVLPLAGRGESTLELAWKRGPTEQRMAEFDPALPVLGRPRPTTMVTLHTAAGARPIARDDAWRELPPGSEATIRLENEAEVLRRSLGSSELRAPRGQAGLLGRLIDFEWQAIAAGRAADQATNSGTMATLKLRINRARGLVREALDRASLTDLARSARIRATGLGDDPLPDLHAEPPAVEALRVPLRGAGRAFLLRDGAKTAGTGWSLVTAIEPGSSRSDAQAAGPWLLGAMVAGLILVTKAGGRGGSVVPTLAALGVLAGAAFTLAGGMGLAAIATAGAAGWCAAR